jgi:sigma-B regulation protein RsbU (phosphoserine phosphatase)
MVQRAGGAVEIVESFGMPIGLIQDADYSTFDVTLGPGDRLLFYSDGITECPMPDGSMLDEAGLIAILHDFCHHRGTELFSAMSETLVARSGLQEFPDDLSAVLIELPSGA